MENKKNYFKDLFWNVHFIIALLLTSVAMTFIVASYDFGLLGAIVRVKHVFSLVAVVLALFAIVFLPYLCFNLKNKKITIADSVYLALVLIGLVFFLYSGFTAKQFSIYQFVFPVLSLAIGCLFIVLRMHFYYTESKECTFVAKNKISKYYLAIFSKFSYVAIVIISGITILFSYFLTDGAIINTIKHPTTLIICLICLLPTIVYALTKIKSKTITVFDCLGVAGIVALPLILVKFLVLSYSPLKVCVWAIAVAAYVVYLLLRFKYFDSNAKVETKETNDYFSTLFAKYDIGLILSVGGIIAMFASLLIDSDLLHTLYANGTLQISVSLIPTIILTAFALLALVFFALVALIGYKKESVCIVDLFLQLCLSFIVFSLIALISHPSLIMLFLLIAFLIYTIAMLVIRVKLCASQSLTQAVWNKIKAIDWHKTLNPIVALSIFGGAVIVIVLIGVIAICL